MSARRWFLAGALALAAAGACSPGVLAAAPSTQLVNPGCHRAVLPDERTVSVTAVMRPVDGTVSMEMRFDLERARTRDGRFRAVRGGALGQWVHPPNPTLGQRPGDVWRFDEKVKKLPGPAYYAFHVRFRWTGANNRALGTATLVSPVCYQPELRPDLLVRSLTVKPVAGQPSEDRYLAVIGNRGLTAAGPFELELELASQPPRSITVPGLAARSTQHETLAGPACTPGSRVTVTLDPDQAVPDSDPANNTLTVQCPSSP